MTVAWYTPYMLELTILGYATATLTAKKDDAVPGIWAYSWLVLVGFGLYHGGTFPI